MISITSNNTMPIRSLRVRSDSIRSEDTKMVRVERCCCVFPLRRGSIIIALTELLIALSIWIILYISQKHELPFEIFVFLIIVCIPFIGFLGILKRNPRGFNCYVFYLIFRIMIVGIFLIYAFVRSIVHPQDLDEFLHSHHPEEKFAWLGIVCIVWALLIHFTLVVHSYYEIVRREFKSRRPPTNDDV